MDQRRPHPDELLAQVQTEQQKAVRGRLKVFFGACAGVGKTFTMLEAARRQVAAGTDVVVGYVEPHARPETMALLEGLESLPVRQVEYRGAKLTEFDLDAALARKPKLLLVDELAHTNAAGSRHAKRWQDVMELLAAGIDVYTTLNVQHIETLNDVVAQFSGVRVRETVPDTIFDQADEVEIADCPPDELLQRLSEGRVYTPERAAAAVQSFFQKGNLVALRELALRRTAERVNVQSESYRHEGAVVPTADRLLVCVGPSPFSARLVRSTARMAMTQRCPWLAVSVEKPGSHMSQEAQDRVWANLRMAGLLGAGVNAQSFLHHGAQAGMGQHPVNGVLDGPRGVFEHHLSQGDALQPAGIIRVPVIGLLLRLFTGETYLTGVDNHHEITDILGGGVHRLMFPHEQLGYLAGHPSQGLVRGANTPA